MQQFLKILTATFLVIAALSSAASHPAFAQTVPMDPDGFTATVAQDLKQAMPDYRVDIAGPLTIKLTPEKGGGAVQVSLDRVHAFCEQNGSQCAATLADFVTKSATTLRGMHAPLDRGMLRVVVRPKVYMDAITQQVGQAAAAQMAVEPLTEDLVAVCYLDLPSALRPAMAGDFEKLAVTKEDALKQARANQVSGGALDKQLQDLPENGIGTLSGDVYASSWLALHEAWTQPAERLGGELIVAVPAADTLLYARYAGPGSVDAMRALAEQTASKSEKPLSTSVYRWTPQGWTRL